MVAAEHPWARRRAIAARDLITEAYRTREAASGTRAVATAALAALGIDLNPVATGSQCTEPQTFATPHHPAVKPINVTVFSPGSQDRSGTGGVGFTVDLSLAATNRKANPLLSPAAGYKPASNDPAAATFHPGPDPGAPGLVVMNTWQPGKPLFGLNKHVRLTVYVVRGTAPALVPTHGLKVISNTARSRSRSPAGAHEAGLHARLHNTKRAVSSSAGWAVERERVHEEKDRDGRHDE